MVGILNGSMVIWIIFAISYTVLCIAVSFKIYFLNYVLEGFLQLKNNINERGLCSDAFKPIRKGKFCFEVVLNLSVYLPT